MIYYKTFERISGLALAAADEDIIGKRFKLGDVEVHVNPRYYKGEKCDKEELKRIMAGADNINLFGKDAVDAAIELGLVDPDRVIYFGKGKNRVPHAHVVRLSIG